MLPSTHLPLSRGLLECLDALHSLQASQVDAALQALVRPVAVCGSPTPSLPSLATLPLAAQANLMLLLRAAPLSFSTSQRAAVHNAVAQLAGSGACGAELLQLLESDAEGGEEPAPAPPCPDFLYTRHTCFPWAPVPTDAASAAAVQCQLMELDRAAQLENVAEGAGGTKREADRGQLPGSAAKRPRQAQQAAAGAAGAQLGSAVAAVHQALVRHASGGSGTLITLSPELLSALGTILTFASSGTPEGAEALRSAGLHRISDDALLLLLLRELATPASSFARCTAAAGGLLLPRLQALDSGASRDLLAAVEHMGACNPQALISACLQPLLSSAAGLGKLQAELISGCLKTAVPAQLLPDVVAAACAPPGDSSNSGSGSGGTAPGGSGWDEHTVAVLQAVLNAKPALSAAGVSQLAGTLLVAASSAPGGGGADLAASPKFAKLTLSVVKQYPAEAAGAKQQLAAVAAACKSFMAKSLQAAVNKL